MVAQRSCRPIGCFYRLKCHWYEVRSGCVLHGVVGCTDLWEVDDMSMAAILAELPDMWRSALTAHVPDPRGNCWACRDESGVAASWPCLTREVAEEAKYLYEGGLPGTFGGRHAARNG
jgi:hypothetical protein